MLVVAARERKNRERPGALGEVSRDRAHLKAQEQRSDGGRDLTEQLVLLQVEVVAGERRGGGGRVHGRLHQRAPLLKSGRGESGTVDGDDARRARDAKESIDVTSDERRQLFEALSFNGLRVGISVVAARDVERELRGRLIPRVGALLAQHGKDVAEHVAERVARHGTNLEGHPRVTFTWCTVVLLS